ncbi:hypothetical protein EVAR_26950_1 [Eumeta japonica]|uniref:Uncharacterized protein n=1 Tax=Eumeta variegata TaxID=151549 RepID=A0A4C1VMP0_EUMVA|nr:hypothetical protein EVAR_26950_1 [Eumeta japonica]
MSMDATKKHVVTVANGHSQPEEFIVLAMRGVRVMEMRASHWNYQSPNEIAINERGSPIERLSLRRHARPLGIFQPIKVR